MGKTIRFLENGERFGRLIVDKLECTKIYKSKKQNHYLQYYLCKCDCGKETVVLKSSLIYGKTKSCGCLEQQTRKDKSVKHRTHGQTKTRLYKIWSEMKRRCYCDKSISYKYYGLKGIKVCDDWRNCFENFRDWSINNGYKDDLTIDRIDSESDYSPENCQWISIKEQNRKHTNCVFITFNGKRQILSDWAKEYNIPHSTLSRKIKSGIPLEDIFIQKR